MRSTFLFVLCLASSALADWPTARGNAARTGNVDGQPGPKTAKVHWSYAAKDDFIAPPTPSDKLLYLAALGDFNSGALLAIKTDKDALERLAWSKTQPFIKLPTVCAPAILNGKLIFGDGMHQNESPTLYCVEEGSGKPLWQLALPGALIHLEATPTIVEGRAYTGAGHAGVICIDTTQLTMDGKEMSADEIAKIIAAKWAELQKKYEEDKKKDPDFAIPPSEAQLPKPAPKLLWQQGAGGKWHVDTPVNVVGDNVLFGSAYLEVEKSGDRAVHCIAAADGKSKWRVETKYNPWGGASVSGNIAVVGCSSIRLDPKEVPDGKGEIVAIDIASGNIKWRKDIPGGIVSPVAISGKLAVFTATDGFVHAHDVETGDEKWTFDGKAPYFAAPAIAGDVVYAGNLNGVVHAINLADGKQIWRLDIGKETKAPGNIYGSLVVHGGKVYAGTCNIEAPDAKTVVVCIGEK